MLMSEDAYSVELLPSADDAVADMRATAKWTIAAAAAVGALLLGGAPLAATNKIHGAGHVVLAAIGLTLALAAVAWIIRQISETLMPRVVSLSALDDPDLADLRRLIEVEPTTFFGDFGDTRTDLAAAALMHDRVVANTAYLLAREQDPARMRLLEQTLADARANSRSAHQLQRQLLEFVHAWKVRGAVRTARRHTLFAALVVLIGATVFLATTGTDNTGKLKPGPTPTHTNPSP
jgi:hypothetical protein